MVNFFRSKSFKPSEQQLEAYETVKNFFSNEFDILIITGEAGSGKTETIKYIYDNIKTFEDIYVSALSGRAASVLRAKGVGSATTMASLLYGMPNLSWERRNFKKEKETKRNLKRIKNSLFIFDEASMIPDYYDEKNSDNWSHKGGESELDTIENDLIDNNKIIFVGDIYQLGPPTSNRPIDYGNSNAINPFYWEEKGYSVKSVNLDVTFRQKNNSQLLYLARGIISDDKLIAPYLDDSVKREEELIETFFNHFNEDKNSIKILCFLNEHVFKWNTEIRNRRFQLENLSETKKEYTIDQIKIKEKLNDLIKNEEILMVTKNNRFYNTELLNGDNIKVNKVSTVEEGPELDLEVNFWDFEGNKRTEIYKNFQLHFLDVEIIKLDASVFEEEKIKVKIILETLETQGLTNTSLRSSRENIIRTYLREEMYQRNKETIDKIIQDKDIYEKEEELSQLYEQDPYMNSLWVSYGYAITTHKGQGGEWPFVIVDFTSKMSQRVNWAYTSITRASERVYLYKYPVKENSNKPLNYKNPIKKIFETLKSLAKAGTENIKVAKNPDVDKVSELEERIIELERQLSIEKGNTSRSRKGKKLYRGPVDEDGYIDDPLVPKLISYRLKQARVEGNSPFIIFNNKTLNSMVYYLPKNVDELLEISGMTERRVSLYGKDLISIIN